MTELSRDSSTSAFSVLVAKVAVVFAVDFCCCNAAGLIFLSFFTTDRD